MSESKFPQSCCTINITETTQDKLVKMFKALGNPIRFEIIKYLATHPGCITGDIVEVLPISQSTVSQHLKELKNAGWISGSLNGNATCYGIDEKNMKWFSQLVQNMF